MDWISKNRHLYHALDEELSAFLTHFAHDPARSARHIDRLVEQASPIGGRLLQDIEALQTDMRRHLQHPTKTTSERVRQDAMRIKHEVKEL